MFVNIKYLVITVISIFLALGIGILIGIQIDSQDIIFQQQESLVSKMEEKFVELNNVKSNLEKELEGKNLENDQKEQYMKNIFPDYIKGKLEGLNIAIIETSDDYVYTTMRHAPKLAGANINSVTIISDKIMALNQEERSEIFNYFAERYGIQDEQNLVSIIVRRIGTILTENTGFEDLNFLQEKGLIDSVGSFEGPIDYVIVAGGSKEKTDKYAIIDIPLIREFKKRSIPVVGVESKDVAFSYMDFYKKEKISTIDNVDDIIGQTSLVFVMTGMNGNYGVKKTANSLMPILSEEEGSSEDIRTNTGS